MRVAIMVFGAAFIVAVGAVSGHSEEYPWCTEFDPFTRYCSFARYQDCIAVAKGVGATCIRNGQYHAAVPESARAKPLHKQH